MEARVTVGAAIRAPYTRHAFCRRRHVSAATQEAPAGGRRVMWRVTADNGLPRCEGYRWVRFGLLGSSFGGGLAVSGRDEATCLPLSGGGSGLGGEGQLLTDSQHQRGLTAEAHVILP